MKRRKFIAITGASIGTASIAGCVGGNGNGSVDKDASELILSIDEISGVVPGSWEEENLGIIDAMEESPRAANIKTSEGVELENEDDEGVVFAVAVTEAIEDAKTFFDDQESQTDDENLESQDIGDESFAIFASGIDWTNLTVRERNVMILVISTLPISWHRELAELQIDEL